MRRPSPAPLDILPTDPHRGAGTFRRGLHPRPPVRPWQHHTLNCTTPHSFHPNNPNVHVPWPLHTVGHFYMSGQAPPFVVATGGDFKLTLFTTVAQAQEHMATICRKSHAPSWLGLKPRFQHSLLVGHGQPHLKRHTPLPWTGCHAPQPCELRPLGLIPDPLPRPVACSNQVSPQAHRTEAWPRMIRSGRTMAPAPWMWWGPATSAVETPSFRVSLVTQPSRSSHSSTPC